MATRFWSVCANIFSSRGAAHGPNIGGSRCSSSAGSVATTVLDGILFGSWDSTDIAKTPFGSLFALVTAIPSLSATARRLHDMGRSGWILLLPTLPLAALGIVLVVLLVDESAYSLIGGNTPLGMALLALFVILVLATLATLALTIWWLTRPSEPGPNRYGPMPG